MEVKALCLEVGDCWCLLNIIVEIAIRKFSFYFTHICLFFVNCFVLCFVFCVLFVMFLTQSLLLNSLITLGTMLSLSVGVRIGFVLAKKFQIFRIFSSSSS